jgi:hypothetical protein
MIAIYTCHMSLVCNPLVSSLIQEAIAVAVFRAEVQKLCCNASVATPLASCCLAPCCFLTAIKVFRAPLLSSWHVLLACRLLHAWYCGGALSAGKGAGGRMGGITSVCNPWLL